MGGSNRSRGAVIQPVVIDASAVLAYAKRETGCERVRPAIDGALISSVNFAEVIGKLALEGHDADRLGAKLVGLGLVVEPFTWADAKVTGALAPGSRTLGLSLADRACLALARRVGRPVLTADRAMAKADLCVTVELIR